MIWLLPSAIYAGIVFLIDYVLRRKKWKENTRIEKQSLLMSAAASFPYTFCSAFGLLMGITANDYENEILDLIQNILLMGGNFIWLVCLLVTIASLILRKKGKEVLSKKVHYIALFYIAFILILYFII